MVFLAAATASTVPLAAGEPFARPLAEVLAQTGERFGVRIVCKGFAADTVRVAYADFRVRPYSLDETLDNVLHPLGLVWQRDESARVHAPEKTTVPAVKNTPGAHHVPDAQDSMPDARHTGNGEPLPNPPQPVQTMPTASPVGAPAAGKIIVRPYEYYRRTPDDGKKLLAWLASQYGDRTAWERRRGAVLAGVREALAIEPFRRALVPDPDVRLGAIVRHDGYTTQNYALETLPGLYVCGTIYAPRSRGLHPLVVSLAGHWPGGRYRPDQQLRMASFARMGAVAVDMDIFGWGESELQVGREAHTAPYAMQMQVLWSKAVTDWIVSSRRDIDTARMAATGGSGGATHALLLAVVDGRFAALAPVVHLVSHFDGGCPCESGRPVTLAAGGSCMPEILAAAMAPRPVLAVSDGGDWTASYPTSEYPFLKRIWDFYGAAAQVENAHFPDERHDYGASKRRAVYDFFARTLGLDAGRADEARVTLQPEQAMRTFGGIVPATALRSREELERMIENL